ncbi:hypothetical protein AB0J48_21575 [Nocardia salmonicida]|uniref:hypothetical protein n=1 Tax=Nocardia salmonicida TaxID=53431 RepID=UPI003423DA30
MYLRRSAVAAALLVSAIALTTAPATAEPLPSASAAPAAPSAGAPVAYRGEVVDGRVLTTLDGGAFTLTADRDVIEVRDSVGQVIDHVPLQVRLDGHPVALEHEISPDGRQLRLSPQTAGIDRTVLTPIASPVENQLAMNDLINAVSIGTSIGSLVGTAIGATVGIGVGFVLAGAACVVISLGCVVTVLPIVGLTGAIGGLAGAVLAGGPTAAVALYEYVTTLNAAPGQSKYGAHVPGAAAEPASAPR